jgi:hypothetical protein
MITLNNVKELQRTRSVIHKRYVTNNNTIPKYELLRSLHIQLSNGDEIVIPDGFIWDLSSVPRMLWWALPPDGDFGVSVIIHDYLYENRHRLGYTREFADKEMLLWAKASHGTNKPSIKNIDNHVRYYGVRLGGWIAWNKKIETDTEK